MEPFGLSPHCHIATHIVATAKIKNKSYKKYNPLQERVERWQKSEAENCSLLKIGIQTLLVTQLFVSNVILQRLTAHKSDITKLKAEWCLKYSFN